MDDLYDEWGGIDWGSTPSIDTGIDLSGISLDTPYIDLGDTGTLLSGIDLGDFGGLDLSGISLDIPYQDLGDFGTLLGGDSSFGTTGFFDAMDEVGGANYIPGIEGFAEAADEVGGAGGYDEEALKDQFWKEKLGTGVAVPGVGTLTTDSQGRTIIKYDDGTTKVISEPPPLVKEPSVKEPPPKQPPDQQKPPIINKDNAMLMALLGGLMGLLSKGSAPKGPVGYQGGIPKYTATRVPGRGVEYTKAAQGGLMGLKQGQYLDGATDGMADKIQTSIEGKQPARLSHGEFVIPADVVSHLGNGNSDAGADVLYEMMAKVRKARTGTPKQGKQINPRKMIPA